MSFHHWSVYYLLASSCSTHYNGTRKNTKNTKKVKRERETWNKSTFCLEANFQRRGGSSMFVRGQKGGPSIIMPYLGGGSSKNVFLKIPAPPPVLYNRSLNPILLTE